MSVLPMEAWVPLAEVMPLLAERMMVNGSNWIIGEWKCKYIDARIDMRTGCVYLKAGNLHTSD